MLQVVTKRHIQFLTQHVEELFLPSAVKIKTLRKSIFWVTGHTLTCISIEETAGAHIIIIIIIIIIISHGRFSLTCCNDWVTDQCLSVQNAYWCTITRWFFPYLPH